LEFKTLLMDRLKLIFVYLYCFGINPKSLIFRYKVAWLTFNEAAALETFPSIIRKALSMARFSISSKGTIVEGEVISLELEFLDTCLQ